MKEDKPKIEYMNPRLVMRMWMAHLPTDLPGNLRSIIIALWNFSDDFITKDQLIDGESTFTTSRTGLRQLVQFTGYGRTIIQRKLVDLREKWGLVDFDLDNHPHGTAYTVYTTPQVFAPRMIESKRKVQRFIKEIKATYKYTEKKPSRWDEEEPDEVESGAVESPWSEEPDSISPWDNEDLTGVHGYLSQLEIIDWTQVLSDFDSGTFHDLTGVLFTGTQVHGGPTVFDLAFEPSVKKNVCQPHSLFDHTSKSKSKAEQHQPQSVLDKKPVVSSRLPAAPQVRDKQGAAAPPPLTPQQEKAKAQRDEEAETRRDIEEWEHNCLLNPVEDIPVPAPKPVSEELTRNKRAATYQEARERNWRENAVEDIEDMNIRF